MGMGIDGLVSGLDTTSIINALIAAEAMPQTLMKNKVTSDTYSITALQGLNAKFAALQKQADPLSKPNGLAMFTGQSTSTAVAVTVSTGAQATSMDVTVDKLAQSHSVVTAPMTTWPDSPPVLTFVKADGTSTEVTAVSQSLDDMVNAINASSAGVGAVKVASGVDGAGVQQYRLQLNATASGAAGAFNVYRGTAADAAAGTAPDLLASPGAAVLRTGQDASVRLWAGTAAEQVLTSATNTFTAISPGVDIAVSAVSAAAVTVSVAQDTDKVTATAKSLVDNLNIIFGSIFTQSTVSTTTSATGAATVAGGLFTGDSTVSGAKDQLFDAVAAPINGNSPASIGINTTKNGDLAFDEAAFKSAYAKDPAAVAAALSTIAGRVASVASAVSDPYTGTLTQRINGQQNVVKDLNAQIVDWDDRLAQRRASLQQIYSSLEVQLSNMKSQQSWLTSQLGSLPSTSSSGSSSK